jgi:predicted dehydrogenase
LTPVQVVLVGAHGHGQWHLSNLRRLQDLGLAELAGVCDVKPLGREHLAPFGHVAQSRSLPALLDEVSADVVVVATPIDTHVELAVVAAQRGAAVLLEKPPAPTLAEFERLVDVVDTCGIPCQVGFQSLGSAAIPAVRDLIASGAIGEVRGIGGAGAWQRDSAYWARASWAGRRSLDGVPVADGALTNVFAHALAAAFRIEDSDGGTVRDIELELFHANPIECDDTSSVRLRSAKGTPVSIAVTLCAEEDRLPYLLVHGDRGRIRFRYTSDEIKLETAAGIEVRHYGREDLLENLIAHMTNPANALLVPVASVRAFMQVLDAVQRAPDPCPVRPDAVRILEGDGTSRRVIPGIDADVAACADQLQTFSGLGVAWSQPHAAASLPGARS